MIRAYLACLTIVLAGCTAIAPLGGYTFDLADGGRDAGQSEDDGGPRDSGSDAAKDSGPDDGGTDGGPMCSEPCAEPKPHCDLAADDCVECLVAEHCDDGDLCTVDRCELDGTCSSTLDTSCIAMIDAGREHTCAVRSTGQLYCWGNNTYGQIGNGESGGGMYRTRAVAVVSITDATAIGGGFNHTCAVRRDGGVWCWGANGYGQLGNGSTAPSATPVAVSGLTGISRVAVGHNHTCAVGSGAIWCWGRNYDGQLGTGTNTDASTGQLVAGLTDAIEVSAGSAHTCALRMDATVACWGSNDSGQLGDGSMDDSSLPVGVPGLSEVQHIAAGDSTTCALRTGGEVLCWGDNSYGQLADGSTVPSASPIPVPALSDIVALSVGSHICAVSASDPLLCWGNGTFGQLGNGLSGSSATTSVPTPVSGLTGAVAISVGGTHTCATSSSGEAYCWGRSSVGQVGDGSSGTTANRTTPVTVSGL
jgi:alpha-tubulin suppressor-like RCC1 family protein